MLLLEYAGHARISTHYKVTREMCKSQCKRYNAALPNTPATELLCAVHCIVSFQQKTKARASV